ncbi:RloB domain-containing protein [Micrococcales bacterium 31B]|nr:RloB domain-containing protein [Micrococcales bacterium 31B]
MEGLNRHLRSKGATVVVKPIAVGKDPLKVVQKCVEKRDEALHSDKEDYDDCVCLVDVDEHQSLPAAIQLAEREGIQLLISNLKFEVWLRWHAEDKRAALGSA